MKPQAKLKLLSGLQKLVKVFQIIIKGIRFLWRLQGVVFFGGYPYPERQSDGYFQRVQMLDHLFKDRWRIYIEGQNLPGNNNWFDHPEAGVLVLRIAGRRYLRILAQMLALLCILKCRRIYFHSILTMQRQRVTWLLHIPGLIKIIDIHGAVTEEFRFRDDFYSALLFERTEQLAISMCDVIVVVSKSMENYLRQKYRKNIRGRIVVFPMFPNYPINVTSRPYVNEKPVVVYAGGLQKWQQIPKMIDAINFTASLVEYRFYCPEPSKVQEMLLEKIRPNVIVGQKTQEELANLYPECHYGFILREDNIVNRVACPTKLVEYLAMGIVPIVNTDNIGDFKAMGMKSITLDELLRNSLPSESKRAEMAELNVTIYERLRDIYLQGAYDIQAVLTDRLQFWNGSSRLK